MTDETATIETIRSQTLTQIELLTQSPKPSYDVDGQQVSWQQYLDALRATVDWCNHQLAGCHPFEIRSEGRTA